MDIKYKNIKMRSFLETRTACLLDNLKIEWEYESQKYLLTSGEPFIPDFVCGKSLLIECKGEINKEQINFHSKVARELKKDILLISYDGFSFFDGTTEWDPVPEYIQQEPHVQVLSCSKCDKKSFITLIGAFECRNCGNYEGDHDIIETYDSQKLERLYSELRLIWRKP